VNVPAKQTQLPVIYEEACRALVACTTIDEAKYFSDKAEALAAWAKIYKSDQAALEAKRLKLHAYRRMGELAAEIQPTKHGHRGRLPGPGSLLKDQGFNESTIRTIRRIASIDASQFNALVDSPRPPSINQVMNSFRGSSAAYREFLALDGNGPTKFRTYIRTHDASRLASAMAIDEADQARQITREIQEWLDEFEQHLPNEKKP
jgi:hypothetical protein